MVTRGEGEEEEEEEGRSSEPSALRVIHPSRHSYDDAEDGAGFCGEVEETLQSSVSNESVEVAVDSVAASLLVDVEEEVRKGGPIFRVAGSNGAGRALLALAPVFAVANSEALIQTLVSSRDMVERGGGKGTQTRAAGATRTARSVGAKSSWRGGARLPWCCLLGC